MRGPEAKLYQKLKKSTSNIIFNRIENISIPGMPDVLGYNKRKVFFTVELKITYDNKTIRFSPHQVAWHKVNTGRKFITISTRCQSSVKLFQDTIITGQRTKFVDCEPLAVVDDTKDNEQWKVFQNKMLENA